MIDVNGDLIDSFHRLTVIAKTKWEGWWRLDENVPTSVRRILDGGKTRSNGDRLATEFTEVGKKGQRYSAILNIVASLEEGRYGIRLEGDTLFDGYKEWRDSVVKMHERLPRAHGTVVGAFTWADSIIGNNPAFDLLIDQVKTGIGMTPVSKLLRELSFIDEDAEKQSNTQINRWLNSLKAIRLIEAFMYEESLTRMPYFKSTGSEVVKRIRAALEVL